MFILAFFVLAVVSVPLCGGRLSALGEIRLRGLGVLVAALALQLLILEVLPDTLPLLVARGLHLLSYGLAAVFVVVNRRLPGLWVIALGGALNLLVISVNGGIMPAAPAALAAAGLPPSHEVFANSTALVAPRLAWLGDVFAIPQPLPFANVLSVGDVLLCLGGATGLHGLSGSRLTRRGRRARARPAVDPTARAQPAVDPAAPSASPVTGGAQ
ncbi:MAG TPA: DUF5317 family protein [Egibacteraceae bacterium]